jgi:hypothetical protein
MYNGDQGHEKELQHFIVKARSLDFQDIMGSKVSWPFLKLLCQNVRFEISFY